MKPVRNAKIVEIDDGRVIITWIGGESRDLSPICFEFHRGGTVDFVTITREEATAIAEALWDVAAKEKKT